MKCLLVLLGIIALSSSQKLDPKHLEAVTAYFSECKEETGAEIETADMFSKNIPSDPKAKELMFCMGKKLGFQNEAGEIQKDSIKEHFKKILDESKVEEIVEKCAVQKDTPQETAYSAVNCVAGYFVN